MAQSQPTNDEVVVDFVTLSALTADGINATRIAALANGRVETLHRTPPSGQTSRYPHTDADPS